MACRIGKKKALIALARTILVSIYHMIKDKESYKELGEGYIDKSHKKKILKNLKKRIEALGFTVAVKETAMKTE
jgi:chaperonin cofactor prefoldin